MFKKLNIADWISLYRIIALPFLVLAIILDEKILFGWLLLVSLLSDVVDGYLARKLNIATKRGARLDSTGDILTLVVAIVAIYFFEREFVFEHYKAFLLIVGLYILQVILSFIRFGKLSSYHTFLAKAAAVFQGAFILSLLFFEAQYWLFYLTLIISVAEILEEIIITFIIPKWRANVKGLYWILTEKERRNI